MRRLLGAAYGAAVAARARLYDGGWLPVRRLPRPTISVGALAVGGTGKTPATVALCELLRDRGRRPAILSRGYRRRSRGPLLVSSGDPARSPRPAAEAGDEPAMMARILPDVPVAVAARRERAARRVLEAAADVDLFVLDDAFQHVRVAREVDLLVVDPRSPFWEDRPLPAGRLRERPEAAGRADAFLAIGGDDAGAALRRRFPDRPTFELAPEPPSARSLDDAHGARDPGRPPGDLEGPVLAFAGIARPERLWEDLGAAGVEVVARRAFPDHHPYADDELEELRRQAVEAGAVALVTTEKDAVRLPVDPDVGLPFHVWRHRLRPVDPDTLWEWLRPRLGARGSPGEGAGEARSLRADRV